MLLDCNAKSETLKSFLKYYLAVNFFNSPLDAISLELILFDLLDSYCNHFQSFSIKGMLMESDSICLFGLLLNRFHGSKEDRLYCLLFELCLVCFYGPVNTASF